MSNTEYTLGFRCKHFTRAATTKPRCIDKSLCIKSFTRYTQRKKNIVDIPVDRVLLYYEATQAIQPHARSRTNDYFGPATIPAVSLFFLALDNPI